MPSSAMATSMGSGARFFGPCEMGCQGPVLKSREQNMTKPVGSSKLAYICVILCIELQHYHIYIYIYI